MKANSLRSTMRTRLVLRHNADKNVIRKHSCLHFYCFAVDWRREMTFERPKPCNRLLKAERVKANNLLNGVDTEYKCFFYVYSRLCYDYHAVGIFSSSILINENTKEHLIRFIIRITTTMIPSFSNECQNTIRELKQLCCCICRYN